MVFNNNLLLGAAGAAGGYTIDQSIRFNDNDSAYLSRTPGSAGNRKTWTFSSWVKRANLFNGSVPQIIFSAANGSTLDFIMQFGQSDDTLRISDYSSGSASNLITTQLFRDPSAWYHFVLQYDTTQATSSDRMKLYVNGTQVTAFGTASYPSLNYDSAVNNNLAHNISRGAYSANGYFDGYQAEINFIDGTALDASSFGKVDSTTGQWVPIAYTGSYGTNGFYITGEDSADLGADYSGNGNNFTSSGLATTDQMLDTPTDNFCTFNSVTGQAQTLSEGNLKSTISASQGVSLGTVAVTSGKWYWEVTNGNTNAGGSRKVIGIVDVDNFIITSGEYFVDDAYGWGYVENGTKENNNSQSAYGSVFDTAGKIVGVALDLDNGAIWFSNDGTWQNSATVGEIETGTTTNAAFTSLSGRFVPAYSDFSGNATVNFGQSAFTHTPPTGFVALSTAALPDPTIADPSAHFNTILYTGNGSATTRSFTGVGFQPDFVWKKIRSGADHHWLHDAVRGADKGLNSNRTDAEYTSTRLTSFDSDGFSFATSDPDTNGSGSTYVAWNWKAGNGTASNTDGTITSTVSANQTAGFSVIGYTGNGTAGATVGHGLGIKPSWLVCKNRDGVEQWIIYDSINGATKYMLLNSSNLPATSSGAWNDTEPTSSVVTLGGGGFGTNVSSNAMIMYAFAEVEGFSKFGSYVATASTDGPFVYCGFRPAWVIFFMIAGSGAGRSILDSVRDPYNPEDSILQANTTAAESSGSSYYTDFLSNGFKLRTSSDFNGSGRTVAYLAFAESPFKYANAR